MAALDTIAHELDALQTEREGDRLGEQLVVVDEDGAQRGHVVGPGFLLCEGHATSMSAVRSRTT